MAEINNEYDVATVLGSMDSSRWPQVREAIEKGGKGHHFAPELDFGPPPEGGASEAEYIYSEATEIADRNRLLRQAARSLHGNIGEALTHIRKAQRNVSELRDLGEAEFMDGDSDVEQFLKDAARLLRAAQELKGTDETGEMK
jgi:hypothetical protein